MVLPVLGLGFDPPHLHQSTILITPYSFTLNNSKPRNTGLQAVCRSNPFR